MPDGSFPLQARSLAEVGTSRSRRFIDFDAVRRLAAAGHTRTEIAAALGFSSEHLSQTAARLGIKIPRQKPPPRRFIDFDEVRRLAAKGRTQTEIGIALGCSGEHLGRIAFREGIKIPRQESLPHASKKSPFWLLHHVDLVYLIEAGCTSGEVADCLGISRGAVIGRANRMGLQWKRSPTTKPRPIAPQIEFPGFGNCVYPTGHVGAADFHFCGEMVEDISKPYCPAHVAKCYLPARQVATEAIS